MTRALGRYLVSFQAEPFHNRTRYHWIICWARNPDKLVSWGHAPTQELAEVAAQNEVKRLSTGRTQGGRVTSTSKSATQ